MIPAFYKLWPEEAQKIKSTDMLELVPKVLSFTAQEQLPIRSIRLTLPRELDKAIRKKSRDCARSKRSILITAATKFRLQYPITQPFTNSEPISTPRGKRVQMVVEVTEQEYQLLSNLGRGNPEIKYRNDALVKMINIVYDLSYSKRKSRISLRIKMPDALHEALEEQHAKLGMPKLHILLSTIDKYTVPWPQDPTEGDEFSYLNASFIYVSGSWNFLNNMPITQQRLF